MPKLFISYSRKDLNHVAAVINFLLTEGMKKEDIFIDQNIEGTTDFTEELAQAIKNSKLVLYFISSHSINSKWVNDEIHFALNNDIPIFPIYLDNVNVPDGIAIRISTIQDLPIYNLKKDQYLPKILQALKKRKVIKNQTVSGTNTKIIKKQDAVPGSDNKNYLVYPTNKKELFKTFTAQSRYKNPNLTNNPMFKFLPGSGKLRRNDITGIVMVGEELKVLESQFNKDENANYLYVERLLDKQNYWVVDVNLSRQDPRTFFQLNSTIKELKGYLVANSNPISGKPNLVDGSLTELIINDEDVGEIAIKVSNCLKISFSSKQVDIVGLDSESFSGLVAKNKCHLVTPKFAVDLCQISKEFTLERMNQIN